MRRSLLAIFVPWHICEAQWLAFNYQNSQNISAHETVELFSHGSPPRDAFPPGPTALSALGASAQISTGETHWYQLEPDVLASRITLSICKIHPNDAGNLTLISQDGIYDTDLGLAQVNASARTNGTVFVTTRSEQQGHWTYQLGVDKSSSNFVNSPGVYLVDADYRHGLVVTAPFSKLSQRVLRMLNSTGQYLPEGHSRFSDLKTKDLQLFIHPGSHRPNLFRSYCGVRDNSMLDEKNADVSETYRGSSNELKGQYLVRELNRSQYYVAYLGIPPIDGVIGGTVFEGIYLKTKSSSSCQIVYNMSFCSEMAFAVPGNASAFSMKALATFYDSLAQERYGNFSKILQQENCDAPLDQRFSVFRNCTDCDLAYRSWLCAITIPRCTDISDPGTHLRTVLPGTSRNPMINEYIHPGPYKEILPCSYLCHNLMRDCPSSLGFQCPEGDNLKQSYGEHSNNGDITCSYPGAVYFEDLALALQFDNRLLIKMLILLLVFLGIV